MAMPEDITGGMVLMDWGGITEGLITSVEDIMVVMASENLEKCFSTMEIIIFNSSSEDTMAATIMVEDITYNMVTVDITGGMSNMVTVLMEGLLMVVGMVTVMAEDIIQIDMYFHGGAAGTSAIY
ncbi:hypothetical protein F2P56_015104 [Juglans regia]|uniref:Uncharacterized protein n=1 Tax=Juglans regia TaxID=51240 RepID=A0A833XEJ3_JUGRE|nr:hypothetical protein F2P56_015104 [Juglans regia]